MGNDYRTIFMLGSLSDNHQVMDLVCQNVSPSRLIEETFEFDGFVAMMWIGGTRESADALESCIDIWYVYVNHHSIFSYGSLRNRTIPLQRKHRRIIAPRINLSVSSWILSLPIQSSLHCLLFTSFPFVDCPITTKWQVPGIFRQRLLLRCSTHITELVYKSIVLLDIRALAKYSDGHHPLY